MSYFLNQKHMRARRIGASLAFLEQTLSSDSEANPVEVRNHLSLLGDLSYPGVKRYEARFEGLFSGE